MKTLDDNINNNKEFNNLYKKVKQNYELNNLFECK